MKRKEQEAIFRSWITQYQGVLVHLARGFAHAADQDDLVQEMLLAVWHAVPVFRGESSPSTFIYRVAQNTALTWHRRARRQPAMQTLDEAEHAAAPESQKIERSEALYHAIRGLPEVDRSLLLMYLDEMPYRDIAAVLGLSESNVGVRLNRLRARLSAILKE
jgi:RNA polymerase sigma-70 factor (ECF subfamily)